MYYHGTNYINGQKILSEGVLNPYSPKIYNTNDPLTNTTDGYVYLDKNFFRALSYAKNAHWIKDKTNSTIYVFKLNTIDLPIESDEDEAAIAREWGDNKYASTSFRTKKIFLADCFTQYKEIDYANNTELVNILCSQAICLFSNKFSTQDQEDLLKKYCRSFEQKFPWINYQTNH